MNLIFDEKSSEITSHRPTKKVTERYQVFKFFAKNVGRNKSKNHQLKVISVHSANK